MSRAPRLPSCCTTCWPRNPLPPVTITLRPLPASLSIYQVPTNQGLVGVHPFGGEFRADHDPDEILEGGRGPPAQHSFGLRGIAEEEVYVGGPAVGGVRATGGL